MTHLKFVDHGYGLDMAQEIKASEFKARCLQLMDRVAQTGEVLVITKNGRPVAQFGPVVTRPPTLVGLHRGNVEILGDLVEPVDEIWDVET